MSKNYKGFVTYQADNQPAVGAPAVFVSDGFINGFNVKSMNLITVTTSTYTLDGTNAGSSFYFTYAGAVTVTIADSTKGISPNCFWQYAAGPSTTLTLSKANASDTLLGATAVAATESGVIRLRTALIYENDPLFQAAGPGAGDVIGPASATDNAVVRFDGTTGKLIQNSNFIVDDTGNATVAGNITVSRAAVGTDVFVNITNTDNTQITSDAGLSIVTGGAGGGDAIVLFGVTGASNYAMGIDNSASDAFVLAASSALGTSNIFSIASSGTMTYSGGNIIVERAGSGTSVLVQASNSSTDANSSAALVASVASGAAGDPFSIYRIVGGTSWYCGADNSASAALKIGTGEAVGTNTLFTITTGGNVTVNGGNLILGTAGNRLVYTSGANAASGTATLVAGTVTVNNTIVTANSKIKLSRAGIGATGAAALGDITLGTVTPGASFVINSVQAADATALQVTDVSLVNWEISELV